MRRALRQRLLVEVCARVHHRWQHLLICDQESRYVSILEGQEPWNKGKAIGKETWGKTRSERAKTMTKEERRAYFGTVEKHTEKTKEQMSESASARWAKQMKRVMADGVEYASIYEASSALGLSLIHI